MKYNAVIFDFDGTVCDTGEGIFKSAKYALEAFGFDTPDDYNELSFFCGPPLLVTFQEVYGIDPATADKLVKKYRQRYSKKGLYESCLYDGIEELLISLSDSNIKIGIASSKPQEYIEDLLEHFDIKKYFDVICGVTFQADCESKASIITRCSKELDIPGNEIVVVGDRGVDIEGAKANIIDSIAALWGYGTMDEFELAGAKYYAQKPMDVEAIVRGFFEQTTEVDTVFDGRIISVHNDTVTLPDGAQASREVVEHPGGVGIIGLTGDNEVLLVRQFRYPYKEILLEIPAGKLEKGEDPYSAGVREFEEECGAKAKVFEPLGEIYPTPGYCSEIIRLFFATELTYTNQHLDDDEYLDVVKMPFDECVENIMNGKIKDAKTITAVFKLKELKNQ